MLVLLVTLSTLIAGLVYLTMVYDQLQFEAVALSSSGRKPVKSQALETVAAVLV